MEMQRDSSTFKPGLLLASVVEGTTWKCNEKVVFYFYCTEIRFRFLIKINLTRKRRFGCYSRLLLKEKQ